MNYNDFDIRSILGQLSPDMGTWYSPDGQYNIVPWVNPADFQNLAYNQTSGTAADAMTTNYTGPWSYRVTEHLGGTGGGYGGGGSAAYNGVGYDQYDASGNLQDSGQWSGLGISGLDKFMAFAPFLAAGAGMALTGGLGGAAAGAGSGATGGVGSSLPELFAGAGGETAGSLGLGSSGTGLSFGGGTTGLSGSLGSGYSLAGGGSLGMTAASPGAGMIGSGIGSGLAGGIGSMLSPSVLGSAGGGASAMGAAGAGGGMVNIPGIGEVPSSWLGSAATLAGGLLGSQGQEASTSTTRQLPAFLQGPVGNDLVPRTAGLLNGSMPQAQTAGNQMLSVGQGLLGQAAPNTATNPYATGVLDDLQRRQSDMIGKQLQGIASRSAGSAGVGGSRMGLAQGEAIARGADNFTGQAANFMGGLYNQDQNRLLQQQTLGAGLLSQGIDTQYRPLQNAASVYSPFTGFGTSTASQEAGGGWQGALGGALGAAQLSKNMGWW